MSIHIVEMEIAWFVPALNELQGRFLTERIRDVLIEQFFLLSDRGNTRFRVANLIHEWLCYASERSNFIKALTGPRRIIQSIWWYVDVCFFCIRISGSNLLHQCDIGMEKYWFWRFLAHSKTNNIKTRRDSKKWQGASFSDLHTFLKSVTSKRSCSGQAVRQCYRYRFTQEEWQRPALHIYREPYTQKCKGEE